MSVSRSSDFQIVSPELLDKFSSFNRSDFYLICPAIRDDELGNVEWAIHTTDSGNSDYSLPPETYSLLLEQIGIYYSFHKRDKKKTEEYFSKLLQTRMTGELAAASREERKAYAIALSYLAHADSIDGGFRPKPLELYLKVLQIFAEITAADTEDTLDLELESMRGFTLRYTAMMYHRKNFDSTPEERIVCFAQAHDYINQALTLQKKLLAVLTAQAPQDPRKLSAINADIAESEHIRGVILTEQKRYDEALAVLNTAKEFWLKTINQAHPFRFITEQSLGNLNRILKEYKVAEKHLLTALRGHEYYFGTTEAADVAKTFHFLGNLYEDSHQFGLARYYYTQSLTVKTKLNSTMLKVTTDALARVDVAILDISSERMWFLEEAVREYPKLDWNLPQTFPAYRKKITAHESHLIAQAELLHIMSGRELAALCKRLLEMGTYFDHVAKTPEAALKFLILIPPRALGEEAAWADLHISFSYQQLLAAAKKTNPNSWEVAYFAGKAQEFYQPVINQLKNATSHAQIKMVSFAWCLKALTEFELVDLNALHDINAPGHAQALADLTTAADSYKIAIDNYERIKANDNQYARAKNRYGQIIDESPVPVKGHPLPIEIFRSLETFWIENADGTNPFPARFYVSFADFIVKHNKLGTLQLERAIVKYGKAIELLQIDPELNARFIEEIQEKIADTRQRIPRLTASAVAATPAVNPDVKEDDELDATNVAALQIRYG